MIDGTHFIENGSLKQKTFRVTRVGVLEPY
jgi:hypothetical protein